MSPTERVVLPTPLLVPAITRTLQGSTAMAGPYGPLLAAELCLLLCLADTGQSCRASQCQGVLTCCRTLQSIASSDLLCSWRAERRHKARLNLQSRHGSPEPPRAELDSVVTPPISPSFA